MPAETVMSEVKPRTSNVSDLRELKLNMAEAISSATSLRSGLKRCDKWKADKKTNQQIRDFDQGLKTVRRLLDQASQTLYALPRLVLPEQ